MNCPRCKKMVRIERAEGKTTLVCMNVSGRMNRRGKETTKPCGWTMEESAYEQAKWEGMLRDQHVPHTAPVKPTTTVTDDLEDWVADLIETIDAPVMEEYLPELTPVYL